MATSAPLGSAGFEGTPVPPRAFDRTDFTTDDAPSNPIISADRVIGTDVYNAQGQNLGEIHGVMIDKQSGKVAYAEMSFGGFLGIGERYHPLPWSTLHYDTQRGGYVVNLTKEQLVDAPTYAADDFPRWGDREYEERLHTYYNAAPYW